jgi:hypothetical protein
MKLWEEDVPYVVRLKVAFDQQPPRAPQCLARATDGGLFSTLYVELKQRDPFLVAHDLVDRRERNRHFVDDLIAATVERVHTIGARRQQRRRVAVGRDV